MLASGNSPIFDRANGPGAAQVPVRLSLPNRLTTRRSTTTERCAPCSPVITRVAERAWTRLVFFTSAVTASIGRPMSDAAMSACSLKSSVMPAAAKIASSRVGGSRRTRRGPYFVFQSWLIADPLVWRGIFKGGHVALEYETDVAIQLCILPTSEILDPRSVKNFDR